MKLQTLAFRSGHSKKSNERLKSLLRFQPGYQNIKERLVIEEATEELSADWRHPSQISSDKLHVPNISNNGTVGRLYSPAKPSQPNNELLFPSMYPGIRYFIDQIPSKNDECLLGEDPWHHSIPSWQYLKHPTSNFAQFAARRHLALDLAIPHFSGQHRCHLCGQWLRGSKGYHRGLCFFTAGGSDPIMSVHDDVRCETLQRQSFRQCSSPVAADVVCEYMGGGAFTATAEDHLRRLAILGGYLSSSDYALPEKIIDDFFEARGRCSADAIVPLVGLESFEMVAGAFKLRRNLMGRHVELRICKWCRSPLWLFNFCMFKLKQRNAQQRRLNLDELEMGRTNRKFGPAGISWRFYDVLNGKYKDRGASIIILGFNFQYDRTCAITRANVKVTIGNQNTDMFEGKEPESYDSLVVPFATDILFPRTATGPPTRIERKTAKNWRIAMGFAGFNIETPSLTKEENTSIIDNWKITGQADNVRYPFPWQRCFKWQIDGASTGDSPVPRSFYLGMLLRRDETPFSVDVELSGSLRGMLANGEKLLLNWRQKRSRWEIVPVDSDLVLDRTILVDLMKVRYEGIDGDDLFCDGEGHFRKCLRVDLNGDGKVS